MTDVDDLVVRVRAQLDEDDRVARTAIDPKHRGDWAWRKDSRSTVRERDGVPIGPEARGVEIGPHIARWNPARVLRKVKADRTILDWCVEVIGGRDLSRYGEPGLLKDDPDALAVTLAVETIRNLAAGMSDRRPSDG